MITAGIVAEYNPFHEGHKYHIEETRRKTGADYIVVVMSGDYVQRGEPAIADKYFRTEMALTGGADLVLEMPAIYATASAEYFAMAGVQILDKLGCIDYLSFGSEWAEVENFRLFVNLLSKESPKYKIFLKEELRKGSNFPTARSRALKRLLEFEQTLSKEQLVSTEQLLKEPNHILGLEYMRCLRALDSNIKPVTVRRKDNGYHDRTIPDGYASATAIRLALTRLSSDPDEKADSIFQKAVGQLSENLQEKYLSGDTVLWEDLMPYLDYILIMGDNPEIYFGMDKNMAKRLKKIHGGGKSFSELMKCLHTKRLTDAAWRRALIHTVLQIQKLPCLEKAHNILTPYARILGFRKNAAPLLKKIREGSKIDIIQRPILGRKFYCAGSEEAILYETDIRVSDFYEQIAAKKSSRIPIQEVVRQQIIL